MRLCTKHHYWLLIFLNNSLFLAQISEEETVIFQENSLLLALISEGETARKTSVAKTVLQLK